MKVGDHVIIESGIYRYAAKVVKITQEGEIAARIRRGLHSADDFKFNKEHKYVGRKFKGYGITLIDNANAYEIEILRKRQLCRMIYWYNIARLNADRLEDVLQLMIEQERYNKKSKLKTMDEDNETT